MGLFKKKKVSIDYDAVFKEQYKSVNQLTNQALQELDYVIKESLYEVIVEKYNELIGLIDQGAHYDKEHFEALRANAQKELQSIRQINEMNS
ncbi:hypothetical protein NMU03_03330 [Allocoprobacillus halotolerans]|uniref:IDEAL domain-containing protein n=1 Tax=Allocoprobacillus halotolerans TaxID=2944914 RepID=A0ABY5I737_9FIRM|nr:hypothetical protein [Allocoprobacillus halotolerans]UTY39853.1 hypothetical protein NMU03_03330 [Allocoprobacillus halotolerans]